MLINEISQTQIYCLYSGSVFISLINYFFAIKFIIILYSYHVSCMHVCFSFTAFRITSLYKLGESDLLISVFWLSQNDGEMTLFLNGDYSEN